MVTRVEPGTRALEDSQLARRAIAGDGTAFAELYDRHERRVYGFCVRMLGSTHDAADATQETFARVLKRLPSLEGRDLNFVAYVLTCARHACYDTIESRRRAEPVADQPELPADELDSDPERAALLASTQHEVLRANGALPPRQREVLALREVEELSYEEIGELMELNANAVAQLISRARIKLRDNLRGTALESIAAASPQCERALPMLAALHDGERSLLGDWLDEHLAACETCRLRREAMEEAGASYRAIALIVPLVWLRQATIARAADLVGADWSEVANRPPHPGRSHRDRPRHPRRREISLAATVCVLVALLLVGGLDQGSRLPGFVPAAAVAHAHSRHQPRHHKARHHGARHHGARHHGARNRSAATTNAATTSTTARPRAATPPVAAKRRHTVTTTTTTTTHRTTTNTSSTTSTTTTTTTTTATTQPPSTTTAPASTTTTSSSSTSSNPFIGAGPPP